MILPNQSGIRPISSKSQKTQRTAFGLFPFLLLSCGSGNDGHKPKTGKCAVRSRF